MLPEAATSWGRLPEGEAARFGAAVLRHWRGGQVVWRAAAGGEGEASDYWTAEVPGRVEVDVAWSYRQPFAALAPIAGRVAFYNDRVDIILEGTPIPPAVDLSRASATEGVTVRRER